MRAASGEEARERQKPLVRMQLYGPRGVSAEWPILPPYSRNIRTLGVHIREAEFERNGEPMNRTALLTLLATLALALLLPTEAQAMYHPRLGRFLQRDPVGYVDGPGLYEYVCSSPPGKCDALGLTYYPMQGFKDVPYAPALPEAPPAPAVPVPAHAVFWDGPCCAKIRAERTETHASVEARAPRKPAYNIYAHPGDDRVGSLWGRLVTGYSAYSDMAKVDFGHKAEGCTWEAWLAGTTRVLLPLTKDYRLQLSAWTYYEIAVTNENCSTGRFHVTWAWDATGPSGEATCEFCDVSDYIIPLGETRTLPGRARISLAWFSQGANSGAVTVAVRVFCVEG